MEDPNFWDFVLKGGWELLFPEDEGGRIEWFGLRAGHKWR